MMAYSNYILKKSTAGILLCCNILLSKKRVVAASLLLFQFFPSGAQQLSENIKLNQLGFYKDAPKIAIVTGAVSSKNYYVIGTEKDTVLKGILSEPIQSKYSSTITNVADFSAVQKDGNYVLYMEGTGLSHSFFIGKNVHHQLAKACLKGFYYQRASMLLEEKYAGQWKRAEGHPDTIVFIHPSAASVQRKEGSVIKSPGGWYDAGDYNKYIVNSGITMGILFSAYEDFSSYFDTLQTNIPQRPALIPDILKEALYNLRWMFTMQDPYDGGVYHKCTNAAFDAMIMPAAAKNKRYAVQKGTAATLDFAAVMAQASRILKKFSKQLPGLSDSCLTAAETAWQWALQHPAVEYNQNQINKLFTPAITTGAYGDSHFDDEWFWASCELFATTRYEKYQLVIIKKMIDKISVPSWSNVYTLGCYSLLRHKKQLPSSMQSVILTLRKKLSDYADSMIINGGNKAFQTIMGQSNRDFIWGSNAVAMNQSIMLINAYLFTQNKKYLSAALSNLDYVLGRNATGYCFVTGFGNKSTMHPHHRPSIADGIAEPVPGLLAGGPNPAMQDKCFYPFTETEKAYVDSDCAYGCNEIAINWNAQLVYVVNALEALQNNF